MLICVCENVNTGD